jgi:hypothetical protein
MFKYAVLFIFITIFGACTNVETYPPLPDGTPYHFLLNTNLFAQEQLYAIGKQKNNYLEIDLSGPQPDTSFLSFTQINWEPYINAIKNINLCSPKYDSVYSMVQKIDTVNKTLDIIYEALYKNLPVQKIQLLLSAGDNKVQIIYAESKRVSIASTISEKLTYVSNKMFQLQTLTKKTGQAPVTVIKKMVIIPKQQEPSAEIF